MKMGYKVMADTHLGHRRMCREDYSLRPEDFEERILANIRRDVSEHDVFILLGDVCIYDDEGWHRRLMEACRAAHKWLLRGNHDRKSLSWYLSHGWSCVADEMVLQMFGKTILFSHRPVVDRDNFDVNVHGHLHNSGHRPEGTTEKHRLVCIEHHYAPLDLRRLVGA